MTSLGSYSSLPTGSRPEDRDDLRAEAAGRLFFAGEATSRAFPATVHGAVLDGRSAAERIDQEGGPAQHRRRRRRRGAHGRSGSGHGAARRTLVAMIGGESSDELLARSDQHIVDDAVAALATMFP